MKAIVGGASAALLLGAFACASSADRESNETLEQFDRITPDAGESLASVTFLLPTGTCSPGGSCARPLSAAPVFYLDGVALALGTARRIPAGTHTMAVGPTMTSAPITLTAGESRTIVIPVARKVCRNGTLPAIPTTDFGRVPTLRNASCPALQTLNGVAVSGIANLFAGDTAVVPGKYAFSVESTSGVRTEERVLDEGTIAEIAFDLGVIGTLPGTFSTRITFSDPRELPNAGVAAIGSSCERPLDLTGRSGRLDLKAFQFPECTYRLDVPGRTIALSQTTDNVIKLSRVDVDDVTVTREDGSTFVTRGTYELYYGGAKIAGPYATNTGIDVLAGDYELVVKYSTALGAQTNRYTLHY